MERTSILLAIAQLGVGVFVSLYVEGIITRVVYFYVLRQIVLGAMNQPVVPVFLNFALQLAQLYMNNNNVQAQVQARPPAAAPVRGVTVVRAAQSATNLFDFD